MLQKFIPNPAGREKSFYGKCYITEDGAGRAILWSYETPVIALDPGRGPVRLWDAWSATTARHINAFCAHYGLDGYSKAAWTALPVDYEMSRRARTWEHGFFTPLSYVFTGETGIIPAGKADRAAA